MMRIMRKKRKTPSRAVQGYRERPHEPTEPISPSKKLQESVSHLLKEHKWVEADLNSEECITCMNWRKNCLVQPCAHTDLCLNCMAELVKTEKATCVRCRTPITGVMFVQL